MDTDSRGEGSTKPSEFMTEFIPICIREYVAEVRRRDWKKCCPFRLSGDPDADEVLASLIREDDNALVINSMPEDVTEAPNYKIIGDDAAGNTINGGPSAGATRRAEDARLQNETDINEDAVVAVNDGPQNSVMVDNAAKTVNTPSESAACKVKDAICRNEKIFASDAITAVTGDGSPELVSNKVNNAAQSQKENIISDEDVIPSGNDDGGNAMNDGPSESFDCELRDAMAPKDKRRKNLERRKPQKFRRLSDIYKDLGSCIYKNEVALGTSIRRKRSIRPNSKKIKLMNKKRKHSLDQDSLLSRGGKRNRETVEEDCARELLKLLDGNQRSFTEEKNHSRPSHSGKRAQHLVQPPIAISINNVETASGTCARKRIRERSPPTYNESMAVMQLLRLSQTATEAPTLLSVEKNKRTSGLDGTVPPSSGSMVSKPPVEVNVIDSAALAHSAQIKAVTYICPMSRNPAEFPMPNAKKFMRRGKTVKTV